MPEDPSGVEPPGLVLAFDFGRRRIGVACGDTLSRSASPLTAITAGPQGPQWSAIDALIAENPKSLQDYRAGKQQARGSLIGAIMKMGKGFNAKLVGERLDAKLKG